MVIASAGMLIMYICVLAVGLLVLFFSWIFGGDHDHDFDHDGDVGGGDSGYHWFSVKVLAVFMVAFGAGGGIAYSIDWTGHRSLWLALPVGVLAGLVMSLAINFFYRQQCNTVINTSEVKGKKGTVTQEILPRQVGEVKITFGNHNAYRPAVSEDGNAIRQGVAIEVVSGDISPLVVRLVSSF